MKLSITLLSGVVRACSVGPDNTCIANNDAAKTTLCGKLKWYCHDPVAQGIFDLPESVCGGGDAWGTVGCCYGGDGGASCNLADLQQDATDIFTAWYDDGTRSCDDVATVTPNPDCANCVDKCQMKTNIPNTDACWNLKWYCHDPVAINIFDIPRCDDGAWQTVGCCYSGDNGAGCNRDMLLEEANIMYDQWHSAGNNCDSNWGEMREVCPQATTTTTTTTTKIMPSPRLPVKTVKLFLKLVRFY